MYRPGEFNTEDISVKEFRGEIRESWRTFSYSSISRDREQKTAEEKDFMSEYHAVAGTGTGIFAFPTGPRAGLCIHEIFEKNDFTGGDMNQVRESCSGILGKYRFDPSWADHLSEMFFNVVNTCPGDDPEFRLASIDRGSRLSEPEFDFPVKFFDAAGFRELFRAGGGYCDAVFKGLSGTGPAASGMMKGFIDLVFLHRGRYFIADWKSNHLGNSCSDYNSSRILAEMEKHNYFLQYHIYALALHRYLKQRIGAGYSYENHFGGVYYFFVRGMKPGSGTGVFRDRPGIDIIEKLDLYFGGGE